MGPSFYLQSKPSKILIISLRYLGDVLLTTPLISTIKQGYPEARIDVLVYTNTASMLNGNDDIDEVITTPNSPTWPELFRFIKKIFRRYDLSIVTQTGDRRILYAALAAPKRIGLIPANPQKARWKRHLIQGHVTDDSPNLHTVLEFLQLANFLKLPYLFALKPPRKKSFCAPEDYSEDENYVILHLHPQWRFKQWHRSGWEEIANYLDQKGLRIILTGSDAKHEREYIDKITQNFPHSTLNLAGKIDLADLTHILSKSRLFIGPDTGITHLAAATGIPVIALFGPTNPSKWAPWPYNYQSTKTPFKPKGDQKVNNIVLLQGPGECVPCQLEGCDRHRNSFSRCLDQLTPSKVIQAIDRII